MGWLIALAIVLLVAMLPLGASVRYDSGGVQVRVLAGPVGFTVYPMKKKDRSEKEKSEKKKEKQLAVPVEKKAAPAQPELPVPEKPKEQKGGSILDFLPLVRVALDLLADLPRVFRVKVLYIKLVLAGDDPCDLAVNYGRIWAAVGNLWPKLEELLIIKKRDINVECDFTADETLVTARLDLTLTIGRIVALAVRYGVRALKIYLNIMKIRKGGANL